MSQVERAGRRVVARRADVRDAAALRAAVADGAAGLGGLDIVVTSSANGGMKAPAHLAHYAASKFGVVGLVRSLATELGRAVCASPASACRSTRDCRLVEGRRAH